LWDNAEEVKCEVRDEAFEEVGTELDCDGAARLVGKTEGVDHRDEIAELLEYKIDIDGDDAPEWVIVDEAIAILKDDGDTGSAEYRFNLSPAPQNWILLPPHWKLQSSNETGTLPFDSKFPQ